VQAFSLNAATVLPTNVDLEAVQTRPQEGGLVSPAFFVGGKPSVADLSAGSFAPYYECGECVWLFGLFAGARVQVFNAQAPKTPLGEAVVAPDGNCHVGLKDRLQPLEVLFAVQTACSGGQGSPVTGNHITGAPATPLHRLAVIPPTTFDPPAQCATAIPFTSVMPGASVIVSRTPTKGQTSKYPPVCIPVAPYTLWGYAPFLPGEQISVDTDMTKCQKVLSKNVHHTVSSGPPGPPKFVYTVCPDTTQLYLDDLAVNGVLRLTFSNPAAVLYFGITKAHDGFNLSIGQAGAPILLPGTTITAEQSYCPSTTGWSVPAATTTVLDDAPAVPVLTSPMDKETVMTQTVALWWDDGAKTVCNKATKYDVWVGTTNPLTPQSLVFVPMPQPTSSPIPIPANLLQPGVPYYWQVRAYHGSGSPSKFTAPWMFELPGTPSGVPPPPGNTAYQFCISCGNVTPDYTVIVMAASEAEAENIVQGNLSSGCMYTPGPCSDGN
jgi:hypothetical protein